MPRKSRRLGKKNNATKKGGLLNTKLSKNMSIERYRKAYIEKFKSLIAEDGDDVGKIDPQYLNAFIHDKIGTHCTYNIKDKTFSMTNDSSEDDSSEDDFFKEFAYKWDEYIKNGIGFKLQKIRYYDGRWPTYKDSTSLGFFIWGTNLYRTLFPTRKGEDRIKKGFTQDDVERLTNDINGSDYPIITKIYIINLLNSLFREQNKYASLR
jgi:hypothetical protein